MINVPENVLSLVRAFGTGDKRRHTHPGAHVQAPDEFIVIENFLAERLTKTVAPKEDYETGNLLMIQN